MNDRERLIELIRDRAFKYSETPAFRLSSGIMSRYYFNLKKVTFSPEGQYLVGRLFYGKIKELGTSPKAVGGLTLGADPIATAVARYSYDAGDPIEAFVIRKEPKAHGMGLQIEGCVAPGDRVVIVEDVVTSGASTIKAIDAAEGFGLKIVAVMALLDRCEQNGRQNIEAKGYPFYSIVTLHDVLEPSASAK
ncbi:MAG TPA: orotate phosphoribosyltransferase [Nitrospirae bacterium]|nr:orotate phosphoribosyltransferase [Nitrospirota bacterium]